LNPQPHLISLARSLLTTFLSLTGILSQNPELYQDRVQDLQTIMYNMHDLINQYRPHQARESLILMMEERVERMRAEIRAVDESKEKVDKLLAGLREGEMSHAGVVTERPGHQKSTLDDATTIQRKQRQRAAWAVLKGDEG
jgi:mediator of RNA polymerase II transcription subunit 7